MPTFFTLGLLDAHDRSQPLSSSSLRGTPRCRHRLHRGSRPETHSYAPEEARRLLPGGWRLPQRCFLSAWHTELPRRAPGVTSRLFCLLLGGRETPVFEQGGFCPLQVDSGRAGPARPAAPAPAQQPPPPRLAPSRMAARPQLRLPREGRLPGSGLPDELAPALQVPSPRSMADLALPQRPASMSPRTGPRRSRPAGPRGGAGGQRAVGDGAGQPLLRAAAAPGPRQGRRPHG